MAQETSKSPPTEFRTPKPGRALAHLRGRATAHELSLLLAERQRRGFSTRSERLVGIAELAKALRASGQFSFERYVALAGGIAEHLNEERWASGAYEEDLAPLSAAMRSIEAAAGLSELEYWPRSEMPPDYAALSAEYDRVLDNHLAEVFLELELVDLAALWAQNRKEYDRLAEIGSQRFRKAVEPLGAAAAMIPVYEREADLCEHVGAYYGACAMLGAAAEARLLARALKDPEETEAARERMSGANRPRKSDPSGWTFDQLISIAVEAQWISALPDPDGRYDYVVAGLLTGLRRLRNYLHPGRHAQDKPLEVLTAAEMDDASAAYDSLVLSLQIGDSK